LFTATLPISIYTLSLHDALPIWLNYFLIILKHLGNGNKSRRGNLDREHKVNHEAPSRFIRFVQQGSTCSGVLCLVASSFQIESEDRKSTRLNSSHLVISYAVFCL